MKLLTFRHDDADRLGMLLDDDAVIDLSEALPHVPPLAGAPR